MLKIILHTKTAICKILFKKKNSYTEIFLLASSSIGIYRLQMDTNDSPKYYIWWIN